MAGKKVDLGAISTDPVTRIPGRPDSPAQMLRTNLCVANPRNPRDDIGNLEDLAGIKERQLQSCLAVTRRAFLGLWPEDEQFLDDARYVIVNGNRRWAAARKYGRPELIVVVDDGVAESKATLLRAALDENTARQDFDPIEEAKAVTAIVAQYATAKEAAGDQGWTEPWVSQRKALLKLAPEVQAQVRAKARGGEGVSIGEGRWLGTQKGIEGMTAGQQMALVEERRRLASEAAAERKQQKQAAKQRPAEPQPAPVPTARPTMTVQPASVIEDEAGREKFPAVNWQAAPPQQVPEPRQSPAPAPTAAAAAPVVLEPSVALSASMVEAARVLVAADPLAAAKALAQVASSTWLEESSLQMMNIVDDTRTPG